MDVQGLNLHWEALWVSDLSVDLLFSRQLGEALFFTEESFWFFLFDDAFFLIWEFIAVNWINRLQLNTLFLCIFKKRLEIAIFHKFAEDFNVIIDNDLIFR